MLQHLKHSGKFWKGCKEYVNRLAEAALPLEKDLSKDLLLVLIMKETWAIHEGAWFEKTRSRTSAITSSAGLSLFGQSITDPNVFGSMATLQANCKPDLPFGNAKQAKVFCPSRHHVPGVSLSGPATSFSSCVS